MAPEIRASLAMCITVMLSTCMVVVYSRIISRELDQVSSMDRVLAAAEDSSFVFGGSSLTSPAALLPQFPHLPNSVRQAGDAQIQYESGYIVQTVLDGNRLNISIHSTRAVPSQDFVYALDSTASQLLRIWLPIGQGKGAEVARRVAGDGMGKTGYIDGWGEDALMNHPKGMAVDDDGNVYIADVTNRVIRKITPSGYVKTIAGQSNKTGHRDGEGKDALFSADFDLTFVPKNCSLLVADRGNRRLRMIQLKPPVNCNPGRVASSGHSWTILSAVFIGVSVILSAALGRVELQRRELQRTVSDFLSLTLNGAASDEPDSADIDATTPLLANSAATHRSPPSDLIDLSEAPAHEREHGQPADRLDNCAAYGPRDGENDSVLSTSSAGEEGDEGTSTPQVVAVRSPEHNSERMLTGENDFLSGHLRTHSSPLASTRRITLDEGIDRSLHLLCQSGGN